MRRDCPSDESRISNEINLGIDIKVQLLHAANMIVIRLAKLERYKGFDSIQPAKKRTTAAAVNIIAAPLFRPSCTRSAAQRWCAAVNHQHW